MADEVYIEAAHRLTGYLAAGDYEASLALFDQGMKDNVTAAAWKRVWGLVEWGAGDFEKIGLSVVGHEKEGDWEFVVVKHGLLFRQLNLIQRTIFNPDGQVAGLHFFPGEMKIDSDGQARYRSRKRTARPARDYSIPLPAHKTDDDYIKVAHRLTNELANGDYESMIAIFEGPMKYLDSLAGWQRSWDYIIEGAGDFQGIGASVAGREKINGFEHMVVKHDLVFSRHPHIQSTVFDSWGQVVGLLIFPGKLKADDDGQVRYQASQPPPAVSKDLPDGVLETDVFIESMPGFPIIGTLTRPSGPIKAVLLLIHGSGPNDRDETFIVNKPFRDIAHGLALKGLATLRYDKLTNVHASKILLHPNYDFFTVDDEAAIDAVNAFHWCEKQEDLQGKKIFLLGHSLGGFLLSHINSQGLEAAGYVLLGAPIRSLLDVLYEQNGEYFNELRAAGRLGELKEDSDLIESEMTKTRALRQTEDETKIYGEIVFGFPGWYAKHLDSIKPVDLHLSDRKPVLVLHGARDRQVLVKDYQAWQEELKDHPDATFRLYERLNHIFGDYQGEPAPFSKMVEVEYAQPTPVPQYVIDDISQWVDRNLAD
jgi:Lysophospholipase